MSQTIRAAQQRLADFLAAHGLEAPPTARLLDLVAEVGELSKTALTATAYGRTEFHTTAAWREELGDVAFALFCLASASEIDLEAALEATVTKLAQRLAATGEAASGH